MTTSRPHWLNAERLRVYPRIFLVLYAVALVGLIVLRPFVPVLSTGALGADFVAFYSASWLVLAGRGLDAYDLNLYLQAQHSLFPDATGVGYGWFYPPTFLLVVTPLALLPYLLSLLLFSAGGLAAWLGTLRSVIGRRRGAWPLVLAFPGLWACLLQGQNGLYTAALGAGSLLLLRRRPWLAGVLLGLLAIKPHLAILFAVALLAARAWRTIASAALTAGAFLAASIAAFGPASVTAWLDGMNLAQAATSGGALPLAKMPSVFAMLRLVGVPADWALGVQVVAGVAAAVAVWLVWRRTDALPLRGAVLMAGTFLANPYAFDYDLVWLAFPIAWLALTGLADGWRRGDREVLVAAWLLPAFGPALATVSGLQLAPVVLGALVWIALRRVLPVPAVSRGSTPPGPARPESSPPG